MTTPLAAYDSAGGRRLLVAGGLGWSTESGSLAVPAPLAAMNVPATWRGATAASCAGRVAKRPLESVLRPRGARRRRHRLFRDVPQPGRRCRSQRERSGGAGDDRGRHRRRPRVHPADAPGVDRSGAIPDGRPRSKPDDPLAGDRYLVTPPAPGYGRVAFVPVGRGQHRRANPELHLGGPARTGRSSREFAEHQIPATPATRGLDRSSRQPGGSRRSA